MSEENVNESVVEASTTDSSASEAVKIETTIKSKANSLAATVEYAIALKNSNAKLFYGIVTGIVGVVLTLAMLGSNDEILKPAESKSLAAGQKYTLKSPNALADDGEQTIIRLVSTPGAIAAFDDEENKTEECRKFPEGTHVTILDKQDAYGKKDVFAKVQIDEEICNGTIGWVLAVNL